MPSANDNMYDNEVFADRFRLQLTIIEMCVLIGLYQLFHTQIVYEIAMTKITEEFCEFPIA